MKLFSLAPEATVSTIFCVVTVLDSAACSIESLTHRNFVSNPVNQASFLPRGSETWIQTAFRLSTAQWIEKERRRMGCKKSTPNATLYSTGAFLAAGITVYTT